MHSIFACAGEQHRWGNHMNQPKHLVAVNGLPLLKRNIELFNKFFKNKKVYVSVRTEELRGIYSVDSGINFFVPKTIQAGEPLYKTLIPFLQATDDDVLILLGDVVFSEDCVKKMHINTAKQEFNVYGRKYGSTITGCKWGELFAFYIPQSFKDNFIGAVNAVEKLHENKKVNRFSGWEIISYIYSGNTPDDISQVFNNRLFPSSFIEIDDETEDFDYPEDYNRYLSLVA